MFSITIAQDSLKALALIAPKSDVRYYLNGVCIDTTTAGRVHLVSCDGHRLLIVGNAQIEGDIVAGQFIVPIDVIKGAKPYAKGGPIVIEIRPSGTNAGAFDIRGSVTTSGALIDGRYPDWHRVLPERRSLGGETTGATGYYNLTYLGDFGRIAELLGCKYPFIVHNGESSALINLGADAFGVCMPIRADTFAGIGFVDWMEPVKVKAVEERKAA